MENVEAVRCGTVGALQILCIGSVQIAGEHSHDVLRQLHGSRGSLSRLAVITMRAFTVVVVPIVCESPNGCNGRSSRHGEAFTVAMFDVFIMFVSQVFLFGTQRSVEQFVERRRFEILVFGTRQQTLGKWDAMIRSLFMFLKIILQNGSAASVAANAAERRLTVSHQAIWLSGSYATTRVAATKASNRTLFSMFPRTRKLLRLTRKTGSRCGREAEKRMRTYIVRNHMSSTSPLEVFICGYHIFRYIERKNKDDRHYICVRSLCTRPRCE